MMNKAALCLAFMLFSVPAGWAQDRVLMSTEHADSKATVMIIDGNATLRLESPGAQARTLTLGSDWKGVSNVRFSPNASRLAIIARAASPQVSIVDVAGSRVMATYPVVAAAVSPDGRAVILEHLRKSPQSEKARFSLIPLHAPDDPSLAKATAFDIHTDGRGHVRHSDFQWTDPEVVSFIELVGADAHVVALQVDQSGQIQKRGEKPLPVGELVDASKATDGMQAAKVVAGAEITRIPSAGLILRLQFPPNPALRLRTTDVRVWE